MSSFHSPFWCSQNTHLFGHSTAIDTNLYRKFSIFSQMIFPRHSKRKSKSDYASLDGRPRIDVNDTLKDLKSIGPIRTLPNASTSFKLLELCFHRMTTHIWYRLSPIDLIKCDEFAFSVGQSWDLLRPLIIHLG